MSGTEDGQLGSPADVNLLSGDEEHETDSLDIKPPQASVAHVREGSGVRRKDKQHSKEKKQRDRGKRDVREDDGIDRDRRGDVERRDHRQEMRFEADVMRYHRGGNGGGVGYDREDSRDMMPQIERRTQKYYDRSGDMAGGHGSLGHHNYHHHQPPPYHHMNQMHMQRHRHIYYNPRGHGYAMHYNRHAHGGHMDYQHQHPHQYELDMQRERRSYDFEPQKDPESLEQDLRSRLLSKRHKFVNNESDEYYNEQQDERRESEADRFVKSYEECDREREKPSKKSVHSKPRREKKRESIIEVLDSPELSVQPHKKQRKLKRRNKERTSDSEKRKTPDDPELIARRAKLLAAEREKQKRKKMAREELEARRELRREQKEVVDVLSPTVVAASVTAGLNIVKRKRKNSTDDEKQKRLKGTTNGASKEDEDLEKRGDESDIDEEEEVDSDSGSNSGSEVSKSSYKKHKKAKKKHKTRDDGDSEGSIPLPHSSASIGDRSKSPPRSKRKKQRKTHSPLSDDELEHVRSQSSVSEYSRSSHSSLRSERSSRSSHSSRHSLSRSSSSQSYRSSDERSRTHSPVDRSRSSSRSRSEERGMKANAEKTDATAKEHEKSSRTTKKATAQNTGEESPHRDLKGRPLPNYCPGIQGCRSVEEFQCLNRIEEGTYGVVYRAKDKRTDEIVALKRLKMEREKEGFPITSLREINTLLKAQHPNIVTVREIVVGSNMDKIFIVMDYVEHDLKSLMETMKNRKQRFFPGEVKCLIQQLLQAVKHLHDNWILHRDLKTSNLLLSHKGILKVGDFGLAREYGSPLKHYTSCVVTLWYRAPELLLGPTNYSTPIDIWSVGCIFGEFLQMSPLFPGQSEIEQLNKIFKVLGTPSEKLWPGYNSLPAVKNLISQNSQFASYPVSNLRKQFGEKTTEHGISLMQGLLNYNPKTRLTAETALAHPYFKELPLPIDPSMFPTWPAKSELGTRKVASPKPPPGGSQIKHGDDENETKNNETTASDASSANSKVMSGIITGNKKTASSTGFVLNAGMDQRQLAMGQGFNLKF